MVDDPIVVYVQTVHDWLYWVQFGMQALLVIVVLLLVGLLLTARYKGMKL